MILRYVTAVFLAVVLAAAAAIAVSAVEPREAAAGTTVRGCTGTKVTLSAAEHRSLQLHNRVRADRGLRRLCVHPALQRAARAHSAQMLKRDYFSHGNVGARLRNYGYRWSACGENIALNSMAGVASADMAHRQWMNSSGHRANILKRGFREVGIGAVYGNYKGNNVTMWTADFGRR